MNADDYSESSYVTMGEPEKGYSDMELHDFIETSSLTTNEKKYCKVVIEEDGHIPQDSEVAKMLGMSSAGVKYIKESLQRKFTALMILA